jgi:hypothetical protein
MFSVTAELPLVHLVHGPAPMQGDEHLRCRSAVVQSRKRPERDYVLPMKHDCASLRSKAMAPCLAQCDPVYTCRLHASTRPLPHQAKARQAQPHVIRPSLSDRNPSRTISRLCLRHHHPLSPLARMRVHVYGLHQSAAHVSQQPTLPQAQIRRLCSVILTPTDRRHHLQVKPQPKQQLKQSLIR